MRFGYLHVLLKADALHPLDARHLKVMKYLLIDTFPVATTVNHTLNIAYFNRNLSELMDRFVQDFKSQGIPMVEGDGSNVVFPSAGELFVFYKKCMVQCSQLSTGPPLLSLTAAFQKFLREFATRVLNNHLPVK